MSTFTKLAERPVLTAVIDSSAAAITAVAAVAGSRILVLSGVLTFAAGTFTIQTDDTTIGKIIAKSAEPAIVLPHNYDGWWITDAGEALKIGNAGEAAVAGHIRYVVIGP